MPLLLALLNEYEEHFCADKGYNYQDVRFLIASYAYSYQDHIKARGEEKQAQQTPGNRPDVGYVKGHIVG